MSQEAESLPQISFSVGGRLRQLCMAIALMLATYGIISIDKLPFKEAGLGTGFASVCVFYFYLKKAVVTIFNDRIEFTEFRSAAQVIKFADITKLEIEKSFSGKVPDRLYVTTRISGKEARTLLPNIYQDLFGALKKRLQKWHGDTLGVLHSLSDGSQDRDVWTVPGPKAK
jgi:hypothetical protein